ncbi:hypothetical protein [Streptomyces fuscichromogenes]|uniref:Uncharacterized protein n=1 Tax=Streptomyces fuscichromogenes TaxID=1324013 RepID=A0A917XM12_9ACTN|nr:hypothetical protein [Streptomyces fuscichromogenes]GGN38162.1 hypothetical protein GCM10011578_083260 [Streptomyces fuscichromogenes]
MYDDNGAPIRRRTRLTDEADELRYLALELETDHEAFVSRGRAPWRGLSGHDPLDDLEDEEFGERQWEDWHDGMYDEDDPERPQRRRPSGRGVDIVPPVVGDVVVRVDPAIAAAFAARQPDAEEGPSWEVDGGRVTVVGDFKVWAGNCGHCSTPFEQRRPASQRRKWRKSCSRECAKAVDRAKARERMAAQRGTDAA